MWTVRQVQRVEDIKLGMVFGGRFGVLDAGLCLLLFDVVGEVGEGLLVIQKER
jgi:hypothetical protein